MQVANWSATEALEKTNAWLTQFGDEIGGIWAANDDMALAAVEALRADGRAGKVPVTGIDGIQLAVEAILKGEMAGTVAWDPFWQGGMGLSIGYQAKTGKFDPAKEAEGTPRVLRHRRHHHRRERAVVLRHQHQGRAAARLERHLGPRQRADPVQLSRTARAASCRPRLLPPGSVRACCRPRGRVRVASRAIGMVNSSGHIRDLGAARRATPVKRARPLAPGVVGAGDRACPALRDHRRHQSEFPELRQFRAHQPGGDDPARARPRRDLHHPDGLDRPLGRGRADARRR